MCFYRHVTDRSQRRHHASLSLGSHRWQRRIHMRKSVVFTMSVGAVAALTLAGVQAHEQDDRARSRPIKHLVVIFQENVSFDHYFATYPKALNPAGEPAFTAKDGTPSVNGLNDSLLAPNNPNSVQPFRLDR